MPSFVRQPKKISPLHTTISTSHPRRSPANTTQKTYDVCRIITTQDRNRSPLVTRAHPSTRRVCYVELAVIAETGDAPANESEQRGWSICRRSMPRCSGYAPGTPARGAPYF